jgi:hypothetical protein
VANLSGFPVNECELDVPDHHTWLARVTLTDADGPAEGARATLQIGPLRLIGTVIGADTFGGVRTVRIVGGAGGWRKPPGGLSFQNDGNLSRREIAQALASSVGETIIADMDTLGLNWTLDPLASAGSNLDAIGHWYVREDGATVLGERPALPEFRAVVGEYEGLRGRASCQIEEGDAAKLLPGALVSSDSMDVKIRVRHARYLLSPNRFTVEVSATEQKPLRLGEHVARKARFYATYLYRVIEQVADRLQLQAVDSSLGVPDQLLVTKAHGVPGVTSACSAASEVLVVFANGDRSMPRVIAYLGASIGETFTAPNVKFTSTFPFPPPQPVALAPAVDAIRLALLAACSAVAATPTAPGIVAAFAGLAAALGGVTRTGSTVVEAQ